MPQNQWNLVKLNFSLNLALGGNLEQMFMHLTVPRGLEIKQKIKSQIFDNNLIKNKKAKFKNFINVFNLARIFPKQALKCTILPNYFQKGQTATLGSHWQVRLVSTRTNVNWNDSNFAKFGKIRWNSVKFGGKRIWTNLLFPNSDLHSEKRIIWSNSDSVKNEFQKSEFVRDYLLWPAKTRVGIRSEESEGWRHYIRGVWIEWSIEIRGVWQ